MHILVTIDIAGQQHWRFWEHVPGRGDLLTVDGLPLLKVGQVMWDMRENQPDATAPRVTLFCEAMDAT